MIIDQLEDVQNCRLLGSRSSGLNPSKTSRTCLVCLEYLELLEVSSAAQINPAGIPVAPQSTAI